MAERRSASQACFGCGSENERGMQMEFRLENGRAVAEFTPQAFLQGYPGRMHGGGVATMLDEAMGWAAYAAGAWAMTARMTTRFRAAVPLDEAVSVSGWVTKERSRYLELRAEVRSREGKLLAESDGMFARVTGRQAEELQRLYRAWSA